MSLEQKSGAKRKATDEGIPSASKRTASSDGPAAMLATSSTPVSPADVTQPISNAGATLPASEADLARVWNGSLEEGNTQITTLYTSTKNGKASEEVLERRRTDVRAYLFYLEHEIKASPALKKNKVNTHLELIITPPQPGHFPKDIQERARLAYDRFEGEDWGENVSPEDAESEGELGGDVTSSIAHSTRTPGSDDGQITVALLPPCNHPIWGVNGIMYGLARGKNAKGGSSYRFDPRYFSQKRDAKVIGANGLQPGTWWPLQLCAVFHGAHGSAGGGISGSEETGCFSIIVSGKSAYHDMDKDDGETLYYSADNSLDNVDRQRVLVTTNKTKSLQVSLRTGRPVRVLRSAGKNRAFAPIVGIRYDGLYRVAAENMKTNSKGGKYRQFKLVRLPNQRAFAETVAAAPTGRQQGDFARKREAF
ncbi:PUA-like domain-containing protein [Immersiella caudata]|uniref:PUA-like domain-containing protein n=1 Tax=Immersiella caudata TaxID=314043 RepID=A0AA39U2R1_9PEZI|nr:PUA-like domain-containing protein [Immersiella caudata]